MNYLEIILVLILAIYGIINTTKWKSISKSEKIFSSLAFILAIIIAYNAIQKERERIILDDINSSIGEIKDIKGATIPVMVVGGSTTQIWIDSPDGGLLQYIDKTKALGLYVINGKLFVSAIIRGLDGKVITAIDKNEWKIFDKSNYEYNNNETSYEVVSNADHAVYFQVKLKNGLAYVYGLFVTPDGDGYYVCSNKNGGLFLRINNGVFLDSTFPTVPLLFKYPREKYYGQLINPD